MTESHIVETVLDLRKPQNYSTSLIARFMGTTWGPFGADRTQVGPMLAPWTLLSGFMSIYRDSSEIFFKKIYFFHWNNYFFLCNVMTFLFSVPCCGAVDAYPFCDISRKYWHYYPSIWRFVIHYGMEMLSTLLALCEGNPPSPVDSPHKGPVMRGFDVFFYVSQNKLCDKQPSCQGM